MMEARLSALFKSEEEYAILGKFAGATLKGKTYKPIFDYFAHLKSDGAFKVNSWIPTIKKIKINSTF
jgi:isoleucyl-tRNA synthetase